MAERVFFPQVDKAPERGEIEPARHAAAEMRAAAADELFERVVDRIDVVTHRQFAVPRDRTNLQIILSRCPSAHAMGALRSFPCPRGYFRGVGLIFPTTMSERAP